MLGYVSKFLLGVMMSFYFFPAEFTFLPGHNTKKLMAVFGLVVWGFNLIRKRTFTVASDIFMVTVYALIVSLVGVFSIVYNNTPDTTYATYVVSMWVWLSAAYAVVEMIKAHHGTVSVELVGKYLVWVCVVQCLLALAIDSNAVVQSYVDRYFTTGHYMREIDRLYGIGCSLDVAGSRFSAALAIIAVYMIKRSDMISKFTMIVYIVAFLIIGIVGNMIARTTTVGLVLGLALLIYKAISYKVGGAHQRLLRWIIGISVIAIPVVIYQYNTDAQFKENIRFAFEGFFSLVETGEWEVHSNDRLKSMIVFPDNAKTWIIGDGYFEGPSNIDPYYVGKPMTGFYMWTDIGYLRFIFYFGLIGLFAFILFIYKCAQICSDKFPEYKTLFGLLVIINYVVWFKVATDIFLVFALFLSIDKEDNDEYEEMMAEEAAEIEG